MGYDSDFGPNEKKRAKTLLPAKSVILEFIPLSHTVEWRRSIQGEHPRSEAYYSRHEEKQCHAKTATVYYNRLNGCGGDSAAAP